MCDTLCAVADGRLLFAKNSDRNPREVQVVETHARRSPSNSHLRTQYLDLGPDPGACAVIGSRPSWLWGFEHGLNEHGVAIGNEKVWTINDPRARPAALLGMDIVRLALERSESAAQALSIATELLEIHGQGGSGEPHTDEPYDNALLIADPTEAFIVETSDRTWVARRVAEGAAAISNRISLGTNWQRSSPDVATGSDFQHWRSPRIPTALADHRLAVTTAAVAVTPSTQLTARDLAATLRDHGNHRWGSPGFRGDPAPVPCGAVDDWSHVTVCMHVRDVQATTGSMICEVATAPTIAARAWFALGSPCVSIFIPVFPPHVPPLLGDALVWQRFARLRDLVESDPTALARVREAFDALEDELWERADEAFEQGRGDVFDATALLARVPKVLDRLGV